MASVVEIGQLHITKVTTPKSQGKTHCPTKFPRPPILNALGTRDNVNPALNHKPLKRPPRQVQRLVVSRSQSWRLSQAFLISTAPSSSPSTSHKVRASSSRPNNAKSTFENQPPPIYPTAEDESSGPSGHSGSIFYAGRGLIGTVSFNPQATVQGSPPPDQPIGEPPDMAIGDNLPPKRLLLMAVLAGTLWTSLMGVRVFGRTAKVVAGGVSLVWLGIVLGISFLEAWVKKRAPLLTKAVAVDVERHVFAAKSYVEKLLYLALVALLADAGVRPWGPPFVVPVLMAVVLLQWEWLEPGLEQRARWDISKAPSEDLPASRAAVQASVAESIIYPVPKEDIHEMYRALEAVKVLVLVSLAVWALKGRP